MSAATVASLQRQVRDLQGRLDLANADAEAFRKEWQDLRLRNQALGVDALTGDQKRLEDRVVEAVKELYQTEHERKEAMVRLQQLLDATRQVLQGATLDSQSRKDVEDYEVALRSTKEFLAARDKTDVPLAADLDQGQIVHVNPALNAVILNLGSEVDARVKTGTPFLVLRDGKVIGRVKVLEVREQVSAALVESVEKGMDLKIGDQVAVAAEK